MKGKKEGSNGTELKSKNRARTSGMAGAGTGAGGHVAAIEGASVSTPVLTLESVEAYVRYRSFDVIGCGSYRKYVNAAKDACESWAVDMLGHVAAFQASVRVVQSLVDDLAGTFQCVCVYACG